MSFEVVPRQDGGMGINYGLNRVRFPAPVPSGSRVRGTFRVEAVDEFDGGFQATMTATIEREGGEKPVCVAELVFRYYPEPRRPNNRFAGRPGGDLGSEITHPAEESGMNPDPRIQGQSQELEQTGGGKRTGTVSSARTRRRTLSG